MDVWTGSIALTEEASLPGIKLHGPNSNGQIDLPKGTTLSLKSFVNPALIPLHARAGHNLEFHASRIESTQWLKRQLLSNIWLDEEDLDRLQSLQCPVGLLIGVNNNGPRGATSMGCTVSDFLVFGILSNTVSFEQHPPTPPGSSSDGQCNGNGPSAIKRELRTYAIPLSESLVSKAESLPSPPKTPDNARTGDAGADANADAELIPDLRSPSPKRKRVATLFEVAAQHHRRVRQKGGEAVSQVMASAHSHSQSQSQQQTLKIKRESEEFGIPALGRIASQRGRSVSLGTNSNSYIGKSQDPFGPSSSRGLTRAASVRRSTPKPLTETSDSPALSQSSTKPSSTTQDPDAVIAQNKHLITRTILTCMRLFGYNRATSTSRSTSTSKNAAAPRVTPGLDETDGTPVPVSTSTTGTEEDDFKAMYHATYRASTFALRRYLNKPSTPGTQGTGTDARSPPPVLTKEKAMTLIDDFLRLFCEEH